MTVREEVSALKTEVDSLRAELTRVTAWAESKNAEAQRWADEAKRLRADVQALRSDIIRLGVITQRTIQQVVRVSKKLPPRRVYRGIDGLPLNPQPEDT